MSVSTVHAVYFSGTGTTEKTVRRIARRLADKLGAAYAEYSYTLPDARKRELTVPAGDLAVVGCPTYAGRVPNLLMPYLRDMVHGAGALAVPVALFGNRNYDDALSRRLTEQAVRANLRMRELGFKPYIAPALSSGALSLLLCLRGRWHCSSTYLDGVFMGARNRVLPTGTELERLPLPQALQDRLQTTMDRLRAID